MSESEQGNNPAKTPSASDTGKDFSLLRLLVVLIPLALIAIVGSKILGNYWERTAREELEQNTIATMLGGSDGDTYEAAAIVDEDSDLVADSPPDEECIAPETIKFSFVASNQNRDQANVWKEFLASLSDQLGKPVEYVHFSKTKDQLDALRNNDLHVAVLNTGTVPTAVETANFVPLATFGEEDGSYGYTMQMIVPTGSSIQQIKQLQGEKITFTRPTSNSGFKAAFVTLLDEFNMQPERDYDWGFSLGHEESIKGIAAGKFAVAPIASDVLERMAARGEVENDAVRSIYESQIFPPATVGYLANLKSDLRDGIKQALMDFDWAGTGIETEFGGGKFVPVNYKDDWAETRKIDEAIAQARKKHTPARKTLAKSSAKSSGSATKPQTKEEEPAKSEAEDAQAAETEPDFNAVRDPTEAPSSEEENREAPGESTSS